MIIVFLWFLGNGGQVASSARDNTVKLWNVGGPQEDLRGRENRCLFQTYEGHVGDVNSCAYLDKGR